MSIGPATRTQLLGSAVAGGLSAAVGIGVLIAPIFGLALAATPVAVIGGALFAHIAARADNIRSALFCGLLLGAVCAFVGAFTYVGANLLASSDPQPRSPLAILLFGTIASLTLAVLAAPVGLGLGAIWAVIVHSVVRSSVGPKLGTMLTRR